MPQILASGKAGSNKYDNRATNPNKVLPRLDMRQIAQSFQRFYEVVKGVCLSGNEGYLDALDDDLSIINATNLASYKNDFTQGVQTLVSAACILEVDAGSTENAIILNAKKISADLAPDGNDYSVAAPLPFSWQDDLTFKFRAVDTNTDVVTISIPDLAGLSGSIELINENGESLPSNTVISGRYCTIVTKTVLGDKKAILLNAIVERDTKSAIINGDYEIWQRGATFAAISNSSYFADRWKYNKAGASVHTISRSSDVPTVGQAGILFNYSALIDCTTIDASIAANDYVFFEQPIEGYNFRAMAQKPLTASFWVKSTKTGIYSIALQNGGEDRSNIAEYVVNSADTWEFKTVNFIASPASGSWDYTNGIGVKLIFTLAAGSTFQASAGSWQNGNFIATANQVNACDNAANNYRICGVKLETGTIATPFEYKSIMDKMLDCERYYEKSYNIATPPSTPTSTDAIVAAGYQALLGDGVKSSSLTASFKTRKRSIPTIYIYSPSGNLGVARQDDLSEIPADDSLVSESNFTIQFVNGSGRHGAIFHFVADSEF